MKEGAQVRAVGAKVPNKVSIPDHSPNSFWRAPVLCILLHLDHTKHFSRQKIPLHAHLGKARSYYAVRHYSYLLEAQLSKPL